MHVPFCRDRCTYCSFPTVADRPDEHEDLLEALMLEADRSALEAPLETLYLGGGTPSLLEPPLLARLVDGFRRRPGLVEGAEITLETNPDQVTSARLAAWAELGVTRLSVGVQTFRDETLRSLARRDPSSRCREALETVARNWDRTWSADLLLGWSRQSTEDLARDLEELLTFEPPHVSTYCLTVEPGTTLASQASNGRDVCLYEHQMDSIYALCARDLGVAGYERYEVSNFARDGHRSRHNQAYWRNADYLGLGPGASSSRHPLRWVNRRDPAAYRRALSEGGPVRERVETLSPEQRLLESLGAGLRTRDGIETAELDRRFGPGWAGWIEPGAGPLREGGWLERVADRLRIPERHLERADGIVGQLVRSVAAETGAPEPSGPAGTGREDASAPPP